MSERFVSGVSVKIGLYKYSSFPFLLQVPTSSYKPTRDPPRTLVSRVYLLTYLLTY